MAESLLAVCMPPFLVLSQRLMMGEINFSISKPTISPASTSVEIVSYLGGRLLRRSMALIKPGTSCLLAERQEYAAIRQLNCGVGSPLALSQTFIASLTALYIP